MLGQQLQGSGLRQVWLKYSRYNVAVQDAQHRVVIYNGCSGAVLRFPGTSVKIDRLTRGRLPDDPGLIAQLLVGQMIVPDEHDEVEELAQRYYLSRVDQAHLGLTIVVSLGCNFACPYCFEEKHPQLLTNDVADALVRLIQRKSDALASLALTWFGGEPLLGLDRIESLSKKLIGVADANSIEYGADLVTNGYLLSRDACQRLADLRVGSVQVSLDGPPDLHNRLRPLANGSPTFARIVDNIRHAADYFAISIRVNVTREGAQRYQELLGWISDQGLVGRVTVNPGRVSRIRSNPRSPVNSFSEQNCLSLSEFAEFESAAESLSIQNGLKTEPALPSPVGVPCTALRTNDLVVGPQGEIWKCWNSVGDLRASVGTVFDADSLGADKGYWDNYSPFDDYECQHCIALPVCMGGCAHAAADPGDRAARCSTFRITYRDQIRRYAARHHS